MKSVFQLHPSDCTSRLTSDKVRRELGFVAKHTITNAAEDLVRAFHDGKIPNWASDPRYVNIKLMKSVSLK